MAENSHKKNQWFSWGTGMQFTAALETAIF